MYCFVAAMADYQTYPCPIGHYCDAGSEPQMCPAGRMRPMVGATSTDDCQLCRAGYHCPEDMPNTMGIPCEEHFQCPEGTAVPEPCQAGSYCPPITGDPPECWAGYFCPNATGSMPNLCNYTSYCPAGSNTTLMCPLGYQASTQSGLRTSVADSCIMCTEGYYGNDEERRYCLECPEGYFCPNGTGYYTPNICPIGFYCPKGTGAPIPCPPGKYGNAIGAASPNDCANCPVNTFNHVPGQVGCRPCGSSSMAEEGAEQCTCIGANRAYQSSDGSCPCKARYVFYHGATDEQYSDKDGTEDCQPKQADRCDPGYVRLAATAQCVLKTDVDCTGACFSTGSMDESGL